MKTMRSSNNNEDESQTLLIELLFTNQILPMGWHTSLWLRALHTLSSGDKQSTLLCFSRSLHPPFHHCVSLVITEATSTEGRCNRLANFYRLGENWFTKLQTFCTGFCFTWKKKKKRNILSLSKNRSSFYQVTFYSTFYLHCFLCNCL